MASTTNTNGNNQGMPTTLPTVSAFGFLRTSGNTAAQNANTTTNNNDIYGTIINTAPVLADTVVTLNPILEDAVAPTGAVGTLISSIAMGTNITDPNTGALAGVAITAADIANGSWFYTINGGTTWTALGSVSNTSARLLTADANTRIYFQPTANYNGTITNAITFRAWDQITGTNGSTSNPSINIGVSATSDTAAITVTPVNDIPSFTATNPASVNEDSGAQTVTNWATFNVGATYETTQTATYTVSNISNSALFATPPAIDANGNLTYTPAANVFGTSTFDLKVQDSGGTANGGVDTSATQTFTITVNSVNDAPSFTNSGNQTLAAGTNTLQTVANWANTFNFGPADEAGQAVNDFLVNITNGNTLFTALPDIANNGTLTYTPTGALGTATIQVQLQDNGGTLNGGADTSTASSFTITIAAPTVNLSASPTTGTEAGTTSITVTATAAAPVVGNQTVDLALTGVAAAADFTGTIPTQITIANGASSGQVTFIIADDKIDEINETANLTISNPSAGVQLGTTTTGSFTITDNDTAGFDILPISGNTSEFGGKATFDIRLSSQPTADVTIGLSSNNTAEGTVLP